MLQLECLLVSMNIFVYPENSDVANLRCTAHRDGGCCSMRANVCMTLTLFLIGDSWVINGEKKFISSANKAHYLTVAVRTGGKGHGGVSIILVETDPKKPIPGLFIRRQKTQVAF